MKSLNQLILVSLLLLMGCSKEDTVEELNPSINITTSNEDVILTYTSIEITANLTSNGGSEIISRGICWSKNPNPTINDDVISESNNSFTTEINELEPNTEYYFKAFARNSKGIGYSESKSFRTAGLENTKWEFWFDWETSGWNAEITFSEDGTFEYFEPEYPDFLNFGTWTLNQNNINLTVNNSNIPLTELTGKFTKNKMSGTYKYGTNSDRTWNAEKL